ncbi:glycosyltransferase family 2 protein [Streptomyces sp. NPDC054796]
MSLPDVREADGSDEAGGGGGGGAGGGRRRAGGAPVPAAEPAVAPEASAPGRPGGPGEPDVTVVVPVYNTMPYLTGCLDSLVRQSIGQARMEVIAVDDGSTDGSGPELERYARAHPRLFRVLRQPNSGGPAAPSNRALDLATGRYVFFLGSDDYLGPEALARMVATADAHGTDIVLGRMVAVGGRDVPRLVFRSTECSLPADHWKLSWALSNTKLFRRSLIERHGLRYPEDLPAFSDQPFTLEALLRCERVSVLADYDYYFAVRREDAGNVTLRARHADRLRGLEAAMAVTERLSRPGPRRDSLNKRHFTWEAAQLFDEGFPGLDRELQERVVRSVGALAARHAHAALTARLDARLRVCLALARDGKLDALLDVVRAAPAGGAGGADGTGPLPLRLCVEGDRAYARLPGFRGLRSAGASGGTGGTDTAAEPVPGAGPGPAPDSGPGPVASPDVGSGPVTGTGSGAGPGPVSRSGPGTGTDPGFGPVTGTGSGAEPGPGSGDGSVSGGEEVLPDRYFDVTEQAAERFAGQRFVVEALAEGPSESGSGTGSGGRATVTVTARSSLLELADFRALPDTPGELTVRPAPEGHGCLVSRTVSLDDLLREGHVSVPYLRALGHTRTAVLDAAGVPPPLDRVVHRDRPYRVRVVRRRGEDAGDAGDGAQPVPVLVAIPASPLRALAPRLLRLLRPLRLLGLRRPSPPS